ncbi:MAG: hypothetical protein IJU93_07680 [Lachnospiraceae bacterium]|nr:hypothetical protein [Lachnospiraceae bacterium]
MSDRGNEALAYTCPSCGGTLRFDPTSGKLKCDFCDSEFTPEEIEEKLKEKEAETQGEQAGEELNGYLCSTCGAELLTEPNTAVIKCPYCGNNTIATTQFAGTIRPDYVIPFAFTKKQAMQKYEAYHTNGWRKLLLPGKFATKSHVEEIQGVYVPFWLFNGKAEIDGIYDASDTTVRGEFKYTKYYEVRRAGSMDFKHVPADASRRMDDRLMDSIEPYDFKALKPFSMTYLPGFLAERFDVEEAENKGRAEERIKETIRKVTVKTIKHGDVTSRHVDTEIDLEKTDYALLPAWVLTTKWQDKNWIFAMNGQTGEFIGDLPISKVKYVLWLLLFFILVTILGSGIFDISIGIIAGICFTLLAGFIAYAAMKPVSKAMNADKYMDDKIELTVEEEKFLREEKRKKD